MHKCIKIQMYGRLHVFPYSLKQFWKVLLKSIHSKCFLGKNCVYVPGMEQLLCGHWTPTRLVPPLVCHIHGHSRLRPRLGEPPAL